MPYLTGSANSLADLLAAIQDGCTANGWTLSGQVLHAGNCYTQLSVNGSNIDVLGGTGVDINNALTGVGPDTIEYCSAIAADPLTFPLTYFLHVYPTEVFCVINWGILSYTYLGFGCSPVSGLPGTGGWYTATNGSGPPNTLLWSDANGYFAGAPVDYNGFNGTGPFWSPAGNSPGNSYLHHGLDGGGWSSSANTAGGALASTSAQACGTAGPILVRQPNAWNGESALIPVRPYVARPSGMMSIIGDLAHARFVNIAYLAEQQVITLGADKWRVYPFYKKGVTLAPSITDTGWLGFAVHYDGP